MAYFTDLSRAVCALAKEYFSSESGIFICHALCYDCIQMTESCAANTRLCANL